MIIDNNITAKITFNDNNAQFINSGIQFMPANEYSGHKGNVQQNGIAIRTNLYIAVTNPGTMHFHAPIKQYLA